MNHSSAVATLMRVCGLACMLVLFTVLAAAPATAHFQPPSAGSTQLRLPAPCSSTVSGTISTDTTWTADCSPYSVTANVTVTGATLTIEPGVTVQFAQGSQLQISTGGVISATGTDAQGIVLTGSNDQPGWWSGLRLVGTQGAPLTGSHLQYVTIQDGGYSGSSNLYVEQATITATHSIFQSSYNDGVRGGSGGAVNFDTVKLLANGVTNGGYAAEFSDGSQSQSLSNLTVSGNGTNAIGIGAGTISSNRTWNNLGVPYVFEGDQTVAAGVTLTIQPGVVAKFYQGYQLQVNGTIVANGTAAQGQGIVLTGSNDQPGWWRGLRLTGVQGTPLSGSSLQYVTISDGGYSGTSNLYTKYATINVSHSVLQNSSNDGLYGDPGGVANLDTVSLLANGGFAAEYSDGSMNPSLTSLTVNGNGTNAIGFGAGTLSTRTWVALGVPYIFEGDQTVPTGATLTIQPGVVAKFRQGYQLLVNGTIVANGTAATGITLTGETDQANWWRGLRLVGTPAAPLTGSQLQYVTISDGGYSGTSNLYMKYATINVSHSIIQNSGADGVQGDAAGVANLDTVSLLANANYAAEFVDGSVSPSLTNLTVNGNGTDGVAFGAGTLAGNRVWNNLGVPYIFEGDQTVPAGATLTIQPGVTAEFFQGSTLQVNGTLLATGVVTQPITLTGKTQQPGWWRGIRLVGTPANRLTGSQLSYVTVEYAGYSGSSDIYIEQATITVNYSTIRQSGVDGVYAAAGGAAVMDTVTLDHNRNYAAEFTDGSRAPQLSNLTVTNNGTDAIGLGGGTISDNRVWNNLGVPYDIESTFTVAPGARLDVQPGTVMRFYQGVGLTVQGTLVAGGTLENPITFAGTNTQRGWWSGIKITGTPANPNEGSIIDYATIRDGGYSGNPNISVQQGKLKVLHSVIELSGADGFYAGPGGGGSTIEYSQIISNTNFGVENTDSTLLQAPNNWWGASDGPTVGGVCTGQGGTGSKITGNIAFTPVITNLGTTPPPYAPGNARIITMNPQRWMVPVNTRDYVLIVVNDGNGNPLPGRKVTVTSSRGSDSIDSGGITDTDGKVYAIVTGSAVGDSLLTATLQYNDVCEQASSPTTKISFTANNPGGDLAPDMQAPYMTDRIQFSPNPIIQNVPVTITARLTNPNNFPIVINGTFGFAQMGIGLTFGPIGTVTNKVIPANSDAVFSTTWLPVISGHYCFQFQYSYGTQGLVPAGVQPMSGGGLAQRNQDTQPAPFTTPGQHESLNKARNATLGIRLGQAGATVAVTGPLSWVRGAVGFFIPNMITNKLIGWDLDKAGQISDALSGDPPRQDYTVLATVQPITFDKLVAGPNLPQARADAANAFIAAMLDMTAKGEAASITFDRYGGATEAHDLTWASLQATTYLKYKYETGQAMIAAGNAFDAFLQELHNEGATGLVVTPDAYKAYQDQLKAQGHFDQDSIDMAHKLGFSDAEIAAAYQERISADPNDAAVDLMQAGAQLAAALKEAGYALIAPPPMPSISIGGSAGILPTSVTPQDASNPNLLRAYASTYTFQVANPQNQTATINLNVRRINLPSDWSVDAPASVTLDPGKSTTVTVTVTAGMPVVQETQPSLAIEGYISGSYIGGVVLDVLVPSSKPQLVWFLPVTQRHMTAGW